MAESAASFPLNLGPKAKPSLELNVECDTTSEILFAPPGQGRRHHTLREPSLCLSVTPDLSLSSSCDSDPIGFCPTSVDWSWAVSSPFLGRSSCISKPTYPTYKYLPTQISQRTTADAFRMPSRCCLRRRSRTTDEQVRGRFADLPPVLPGYHHHAQKIMALCRDLCTGTDSCA